MIKRYGRKEKKKHNSAYYINSFCCTIQKLTKIKKILKNFHIIETLRSNQESLGANSLVIKTNDATKGKNDESSKIEQIWTD